jgi:MFS family permease
VAGVDHPDPAVIALTKINEGDAMSLNSVDKQPEALLLARPPISQIDSTVIESDIPARLDRLPWGQFHWLIVVALGITWVLNGLVVTLAGTFENEIKDSMELTNNTEVGFAIGTAYLLGAVFGALVFGWLTDRWGRKRLFTITLIVYSTFTVATAFSPNILTFVLFRCLTGAGIGGEYVAINSMIQELIPPKYRGRVVLAINGSFWIGAAIAAVGSIVGLNWRAAFFVSAALACPIYFMRRWIPESPRWLMTHHRPDEGATIVGLIEEDLHNRGRPIPPVGAPPSRLRGRRYTPLREVLLTLRYFYPRRTAVGLSLMAAQAVLYNAIFFTYVLVLKEFYLVNADQVGWYLIPFAAGNFFGPLMLGWTFDTVGRRPMIALTYAVSGLLLAGSGALFVMGATTANQQTAAWALVFFFASAAASSAYLTVGETFPLEIRAMTIAVFYAIGTGISGAPSPWLFAVQIDTLSRPRVFFGYLLGSALMIAAAIVQWCWGIAAEGKSLERVARPLTFTD